MKEKYADIEDSGISGFVAEQQGKKQKTKNNSHSSEWRRLKIAISC